MSFYSYFGSILYFFNVFKIAFIGIHLFGGCGGPEKDQNFVLAPLGLLVPLPSDAACQLDVFGHNGYPFCVDGTKVSILKEAN